MMTYMFYVVKCAWCNKQLALEGTDDPRMDQQVSHSICEPCLEKISNE